MGQPFLSARVFFALSAWGRVLHLVALFRKQALANYLDPEARGGLLKARSPSGFPVFAIVFAVFVGAIVLAALTDVVVMQSGMGMIHTESGLLTARSEISGRVLEIHQPAGSRVKAGTALATIRGELGTFTLRSGGAGILDHLAIALGDDVLRGDAIAEVVTEGPLWAYMAFPASQRESLQPNTPVRLRLAQSPDSAVTAHVARIREAPLTAERATELLGPNAANQVGELLVELRLEPNSSLHHGATFTGEIDAEKRSVLALLFPLFDE